MRKLLFIVNPVAGKGDAKAMLAPIQEKVSAACISYEIQISTCKGQIETIARDAVLEGVNEIIGVGGDGTLVELINGVRSAGGTEVIVGIIPSGTGNDFSRMLYKNNSPINALDTIIRGSWLRSDLFDCNGTKFINVCAMGIDGQIIMDTERIKKRIPGPSAYLISTIKALLLFQPRKTTLMIDGKKLTRKIIIIAIGNGQYVGGGMKITPKAVIDDGLMDVCIVNALPKIRLLMLFPSIFKGAHLNVKEVEYFKCREVEVESIERTLLVNVDGNIIGTTPVKIVVSDEKMKVFCEL